MNFDLNEVRQIFLFKQKQKEKLFFFIECQYGHIECEFAATCTAQHECQCVFNCNDDGESVEDNTTGIKYPNQCRLNEAQCNSYYQQSLSKKGM